MAHAAKYTQAQSGHLINHYNRDKGNPCNRSNENIDPERTNQNYNLMMREQTPQEYLTERLDEVYHINRADVNVMVDWCITLPRDFDGTRDEFFTHTVDFLNERYGAENCIGAFVHNDESTPHLHYAFIPVVPDLKHKDYEVKLNAKEVISRTELRDFHPDLQNYLREKLPDRTINIYDPDKKKTKSVTLERYKLNQEMERLEQQKTKADRLETTLQNRYKDMEQKVSEYKERADYFNSRDRFIERAGTNEYTYTKALREYERSGDPIFTFFNREERQAKAFIEPELKNPDRTEKERNELYKQCENFYKDREVTPLKDRDITRLETPQHEKSEREENHQNERQRDIDR